MIQDVDSKHHGRLLFDGPASGPWNMAVDETLLDSADAQGLCTLRFYGWSEATLSLGYFQPVHLRQRHPPSRGCPLVRRPSGGGALLHDAELTYSLSLPATHPLVDDAEALYRVVHTSLIEALAQAWGIVAGLSDGPCGGQAFLCFERRGRGDLLIEKKKVCGSAQRRRRGAVLQHGSVLLRASPAAPEVPGLNELTGRSLSAAEVAEAWWPVLSQAVGLRLEPVPLTPDERLAAERVQQRFGSAAWNERR